MGSKRGDYFAYVVDEKLIGVVYCDSVTAGFFGWKPYSVVLPDPPKQPVPDGNPDANEVKLDAAQSVVIFSGITKKKSFGRGEDYVIQPLRISGRVVYEIVLKSRTKVVAPKLSLQQRRAAKSEEEALALEKAPRTVMTVRFPTTLINSKGEPIRVKEATPPAEGAPPPAEGDKKKPKGMGINLAYFARYLTELAPDDAKKRVLGFRKKGGQLVQFRPDITIEDAEGGVGSGKASILGRFDDDEDDVIDAEYFDVNPHSNLALPQRRRLMLPSSGSSQFEYAEQSLIPQRRR